ncbi:unnamed protein product [Schistosoma turkestanicum]|nr:unnamed protein product [Schistosoma turkestanicum]
MNSLVEYDIYCLNMRETYAVETENSNHYVIENSTELYNSEDLVRTVREEWDSIVSGNLSTVSAISGENDSTLHHEQWNSNIAEHPASTNFMEEINIDGDNLTTVQLQEQETQKPETENNDIQILLDGLKDKLELPSNNWLHFKYIIAIESPDGSIYIPKNHTQSTRKHLMTLLGFAEEIITSRNHLTHKINISEENSPIHTQWINESTNHSSVITDNDQSHTDPNYFHKLWNTNEIGESNLTNIEFSEIHDENHLPTDIYDGDLNKKTHSTSFTGMEFHDLNSLKQQLAIDEKIVTDGDIAEEVAQQLNQSSLLNIDQNLLNTTTTATTIQLQTEDKPQNITTDF